MSRRSPCSAEFTRSRLNRRPRGSLSCRMPPNICGIHERDWRHEWRTFVGNFGPCVSWREIAFTLNDQRSKRAMGLLQQLLPRLRIISDHTFVWMYKIHVLFKFTL